MRGEKANRRAPCHARRLQFALVTLFCLLPLLGALHAAPPTASIPASAGSISDNETAEPFDSLSMGDPDGDFVSATITVPAGHGTFPVAPPDFTRAGDTYTLTARGPAAARNYLRALVYTPVANRVTVGSPAPTTFGITITDTNGASTNVTTTLTVSAFNDPPTISGLALTTAINDTQTNSPFSSVQIADVDNLGQQPVTVRITIQNSLAGMFVGGTNAFTRVASNIFTIGGTPAAAQSAVAGLRYKPEENRVPVGQYETNRFIVVVTDNGSPALSVTNNQARVPALSVNDPPAISGVSTAAQPVRTGRTRQPFPGVIITDSDVNDDTNRIGQSLTLRVFLVGAGAGNVLEAAGGFVGTDYFVSDRTPAEVSAAIQGLTFRAQSASLPPNVTNVIQAVIVVTDALNASQTNAVTSLQVYSLYSPPGLSGTRSDQRVNDTDTITPFSEVTIQSFNAGTFSVQAELDDVSGQLINLSGFTKSLNGGRATYSFTGPSEQATLAIRQLLFQPTPNRLNGSTNEVVEFGITLIDGGTTNGPDITTTVIVTPVNDRPTITGLLPIIRINDNQTTAPFATINVADVDELGAQIVRVTVTLDDPAKGVFTTNSLGLSGFVSNNNAYRFTNTPAQVSAALRLLVFDPKDNFVPIGLATNTVFALTVDDAHGGITVNSDTVVRAASVAGAPEITVPVQQPISRPTTPPILPFDSVTIADDEPLIVTVALGNPSQGTFTSNSLASSGFVANGAGQYTFQGLAAAATAAIVQLDFLPSTNLGAALVNFSISTLDTSSNSVTRSLAMQLRLLPRVLLVTKVGDYDAGETDQSRILGTLRKAIEDAGSDDHITFDLRPTNSAPAYPAIIRLRRSLVLLKNVTLNGPGADQLILSGDTDGDGTPDVQLFDVRAEAAMHRLTLTQGRAGFAGGAVSVKPSGSLWLSYCAVTDSTADQWGGGIDVDGGRLSLDHCLIYNNTTSSGLGQGGGGVSIYSDQNCLIENTTFSANRQQSAGGLGGGGLYLENLDPSSALTVEVLSCTFTDNLDAADGGTAIRPNVFGAVAVLRNTIVADGQGKNLETDASGLILSDGGNISDDATRTIFSFGGAPFAVTNLNHPTDRVSTLPNLLPLAFNSGPTPTHALDTNSPAGARAVAPAPGTDQRGFWRDAQPDSGAFESNTFRQVIINEIHFDPVPNTNDEFIEFYVPRSAQTLNLAGFQVFVGGVLRHTFPPTTPNLAPGLALVLYSGGASAAFTASLPASVARQAASASGAAVTNNLLLDNVTDTITLLNPIGQVVFEASYVGSFVSSDPADLGELDLHQSVTLCPEFTGVFLPHRRVQKKVTGTATSTTASPGRDVIGTVIGGGNAPPVAVDDRFVTDENAAADFPVLANDLEFDRLDTLRVVSVSAVSLLGAQVTINNTPRSGSSVIYDPTVSTNLQRLPAGSNVVDVFTYTITDCCNPTNGLDWPLTGTQYTATNYITVMGLNDAPTPTDDSVATRPALQTVEDQSLTFTVQDNLLWNDTDPDTDDTSTTLLIAAVHGTPAFMDSLEAVSELGATVTLDVRFNRNETRIIYNPTGSSALNKLSAGQITNDTFYYSMVDRHGAIGSAAVRIQVTGVNDAPTAGADLAATDEDTGIVIAVAQLSANDSDPDMLDVLNIVALQGSMALFAYSDLGALVILAGGDIYYDPTASDTNLNRLARKELALDTFTYTVSDGQGGVHTATVTVQVTGVNDQPLPQPDNFTVDEDTPVELPAPGVLANDSDPDVNGLPPDDQLRVLPVTEGATVGGAAFSIIADGSFVFDPRGTFDWLKEGETFLDSFIYTVVDDSLTIANPDEFTVLADTAVEVTLPVLANDVTLTGTGGLLRLTGVGVLDNGGTVAINAAGLALLYTPAISFVGEESFSYTMADGQGGFDTATVRVRVTVPALNGQLVANADHITVAAGTSVTLDVLANDNVLPANGATLTIISNSPAVAGNTLTIDGAGPNNSLRYTPAAGFVGSDTFTYTVSAGGSARATAVVTVTVTNRVGKLPANDDVFTVIAGVNASALDVLANDRVVPGSVTNLTLIGLGRTNLLSGSVSINTAGNRLLYVPPAGAPTHQEPVFDYIVSDGSGGTATGRVAILVVSSGLFANPDFCTVAVNSTNTLLVLANDAVLPNVGQNLTITAIGLGGNMPTNGSVIINGGGKSLIYTPAVSATGEDTFTYEISDGTLARAQGRVRIAILNRAGAVNVNSDAFSVTRDSGNNVLRVLRNDNVLPNSGERLTITGRTAPDRGGTVTINGTAPNQTLLYTPVAGFVGDETFTYSVSDGKGGTGMAAVTVQVGSLAVLADHFVALSDSSDNVLDVLANDRLLPNGTPLRLLSALGAPDRGGAVQFNAGLDRVLYTPAPGFVGSERFTYEVNDDSGHPVTGTATVQVLPAGSDRNSNTVSLTVIGVNDLPTFSGLTPDLRITDKETVRPFAGVTLVDLDEHGEQILVVTVSLDDAAKGILRNLGGFVETVPGTYTFQAKPAEVTAALRDLVFDPTDNRIIVPTTETTRFTLTANDGWVTVTNDTTTVEVTAVNDAPTISGTIAVLRVYHKLTLRPFAAVTVTEVDDLGTQPLRVTVTLSHAARGYLTALSGFISNAGGIYILDGVTAASATASLRALIFVPTTEDRLGPGAAEMTRFTLTVEDSFASPVVNNSTMVIAGHGFVKRVLDANGANTEEFGYSVATTRDLMVVGAPFDDANGPESGAVYLYARNVGGPEQWGLLRKIAPNVPSSYQQFGFSVAISGDTVVVGARRGQIAGATWAGVAFVFQRHQGGTNNWGQARRLVASDGTFDDQFGFAVGVSGDYLAIGAPYDVDGGKKSGSAYVFYRHQGGTNNWGQWRKILATDTADSDEFGFSVAMSGDRLVIGARRDGDNGQRSGSVYLFERNQGGANNWGQFRKLVAADGAANDEFGTAVSISGDAVVVGAPYRFESLRRTGAAYVFGRNRGGTNNWGQARKLLAPDGAANDEFGCSVSMDGELIAVGARRDDDTGLKSGSAYVFERSYPGLEAWNLVEKLIPPSTERNLQFGFAVGLGQNTLGIGSQVNEVTGRRLASTHIYRLKFNNSPVLTAPIPDVMATVGMPFEFIVPAGTFADPDAEDVLTLGSAYVGPGAPPAWLAFDATTGAFAGTPDAAATLPMEVTATDTDGAAVADVFRIFVTGSVPGPITPLEAWRLEHFDPAALADPALEAGLWGREADPDFDGLTNMEEYFCGSNPLVPTATGECLSLQVDRAANGTDLSISFRRRKNDPRCTYALQTSSDLVTWDEETPLAAIESAVSLSDEMEWVTLRAPVTAGSRLFYRLTASY